MRRELGLQRLLPPVHRCRGLADHLDVAHGVLEVGVAEVVVVEAERLLEPGVVLLVRDGQERSAVVEHVVAADLVGAVRQPVRVLVRGTGQQELRRVRRACGDDHDRSGEAPLARRRHRRRPRSRVRPDPSVSSRCTAALRSSVTFGVPQRRADGDHVGVGLGVHQAREAVARRTPDAGAEGGFGLVEHDAVRRVERVQVDPGQVVEQPLDPRLVRHRREGVRRRRRWFGRVLAADRRAPGRAPPPACSRARTRRSRAARQARSRRDASARRSPAHGAGTTRPRRTWWRRRRSSAPGVGMRCRRSSYQVSAET